MKCPTCGRELGTKSHFSSDERSMKEHGECFECSFWREILEEDKKRLPYTQCVIDGTHYVIEPDEPDAAFQGFGGAEFQIEFFDGTRVVTHNLWCQGEPDEHWKQLFPDNAHFERNFKRVDVYGTKHLIEKNENQDFLIY